MRPDDRRGFRYVLCAAVLLFCAAIAIVRPSFEPSREHYPQIAMEDLSSVLNTQLRDRLPWISVPGAAVAVMRDGELVEWQTGVTRALGNTAVRADTQFEAASLSKPLTAYAIMRLARLGQLDLDAPLTRAGQTFTIRQVLSHSAGFDNNLEADLKPSQTPGEFAYAGSGYLFLGEIIEQITAQTFAEHMNSVVLPELSMMHSQFGKSDNATLALPSIDGGLPFAMMMTIAAFVGAPMLLVHALAARLLHVRDQRIWRTIRILIVLFAIGCGLLGLFLIFGGPNWSTLALSVCATLVLGSAACALATRQIIIARVASVVCAAAFVGLLVTRPALPLVERRANFLPAAGLRTTASDYVRFLTHLLEEADRDSHLSQMLTPQVRASAENDWGLGVGLQRGGTATVWHWGVNFPGYQALAIANRETRDVVVILTNGGQLSFTPSGIRYSGLEASRSVIAHILGGRHGSYWHGIR